MPDTPVACERLSGTQSALGESPLWDPARRRFFWLDIDAAELKSVTASGDDLRCLRLASTVSAIGLCRSGRFISVGAKGFAFLEPDTGRLDTIGSLHGPDEVMNDAGCDRQGRFWAGSKDGRGGRRHGSLYRLDADRKIERIKTGFGNVNGIGWSPDDAAMYVTDTRRGTIYRCSFEARSGEVADCVAFAVVPSERGRPDGLAVDSAGGVWSAHWDGGCITRYDAGGRVVASLTVAAHRPTSCAFGGRSLDRLYVTSASGDPCREVSPQSDGSLFRLIAGTRGQSPAYYAD